MKHSKQDLEGVLLAALLFAAMLALYATLGMLCH